MMIFEKTVEEVIDENYIYARALHYLGIDFFQHKDLSIHALCYNLSIPEDQLVKAFYHFDTQNRIPFNLLAKYPIELLLKYLRHAHQEFIKEKLPFIVHLINNAAGGMNNWVTLLPEFIEDFIKHIYEEEDLTFNYVETLLNIEKGIYAHPYKAMVPFSDFSLLDEVHEHQEEDELAGINKIVSQIDTDSIVNRTLIKEVNAFNREMIYHSEIENKIFFPKALELEKNIKEHLLLLSKLN